MLKLKSFLILFSFIHGIAPFMALATSFIPVPFPKEVKDAPIIVRGKVGMSYAEWGKDDQGGKRLYTYYELQTLETFKGNPSGPSLMMREFGGEKDGVGLHVPGASQYEKGEDVVVFLGEKNPDNSYDVHGMMMGKYNIQKDPQGDEYLVGPGLAVEMRQGQIDTGSQQKWTLDALRHLIQSQAEAAPNEAADSKSEKTQPLRKNTPSTPTPAPTPSLTAPQLQNTSPEETSAPSNNYFGISAAVLGALGVIGFLSVVSRRRK